jgi:hypothetical protein
MFRLSETKATESLECTELEITICEPPDAFTPQEKGLRNSVSSNKTPPTKISEFTTISAKEQCICELCTCG